MFTIQGLLQFYKDSVCGSNLEYLSYSYEDLFKQPFVRLQIDEKNEKKGHSHILFLNKHAF